MLPAGVSLQDTTVSHDVVDAHRRKILPVVVCPASEQTGWIWIAFAKLSVDTSPSLAPSRALSAPVVAATVSCASHMPLRTAV